MTPDRFRALALELPEAIEGAHQGHPDFRVRGKVFASLGPDGAWGMVKLPPPVQGALVAAHPAVLEPCTGAWGRQGSTLVHLAAARVVLVRVLLRDAWRNVAPPGLVREHDRG